MQQPQSKKQLYALCAMFLLIGFGIGLIISNPVELPAKDFIEQCNVLYGLKGWNVDKVNGSWTCISNKVLYTNLTFDWGRK